GIVAEGELTMRWRFSPDVVDAATVQTLIDTFATRIRALAQHCAAADPEKTASDFPLSGLAQAELETLGLPLAEVEDIYPATPLQQGLLFHSLLQEGQGVYVNQLRLTLAGAPDRSLFRAAWEAAVARHDVLRTHFELHHGGAALQIVHRQVTLPFAEHDWSGEGAQDYEARLSIWRAEDIARGFDQAAAPLMRVNLFVRPDGGCDVVWSNHHALADGWSTARLLMEIMDDYRSLRSGGSVRARGAFSYRDYVVWRNKQPESADWWRTQGLQTVPAAKLSDAAPAPALPRPGSQRSKHRLSQVEVDRLVAAARRRQVTLSTLIHGAWAVVLARYSGRRNVVFGTTVSGRPSELPGAEQMVGLFINSLPLWVNVPDDKQLTEWLHELQQHGSALREHEGTPLAHVQHWVGQSGSDLFDSLIVFENYPVDARLRGDLSGIQVAGIEVRNRTNYPLVLVVTTDSAIELEWEWDTSRLDESTFNRLAEHYLEILGQLAEPREPRLGEIVLSGSRLTGPSADYGFRSVMERITERATLDAEREAVSFEGERLSYGALGAWSNRLGRRLKRLGVRRETRVGLCVERSLGLVAGVLGILKAGGAYVPLDPAYPQERLAEMLADSGIRVVVADRTSAEQRAGLLAGLDVVLLEDVPFGTVPAGTVAAGTVPAGTVPGGNLPVGDAADEDVAGWVEPVHPEQLAYVIYTSGSTGRPKGVGVTHRNLARLLDATAEWYRFGPDDVWPLFHSYAFDVSVWELF
ncbi:MAG TPA: condensation domain-containing protein, partial [Rhodopila sp.]